MSITGFQWPESLLLSAAAFPIWDHPKSLPPRHSTPPSLGKWTHNRCEISIHRDLKKVATLAVSRDVFGYFGTSCTSLQTWTFRNFGPPFIEALMCVLGLFRISGMDQCYFWLWPWTRKIRHGRAPKTPWTIMAPMHICPSCLSWQLCT